MVSYRARKNLTFKKKRTFRKKRTTYRKKRSSSKPTRYWGTKGRPRRQIALTSLARSLSAIAETKLLPYKAIDRVPAIWSNANKMCKFQFNLGNVPVPSQPIPLIPGTGNVDTEQGLSMFSIPPLKTDPSGNAIDPQQSREGNAVYIRHNITKFIVSMKPRMFDDINDNNTYENLNLLKAYAQPTRFRLLVVRPNRKNLNAGTTCNPNNDLFRDHKGEEYGTSTTTPLTQLAIQTSLINTRKYFVLRDQKFELTPNIVFNQNALSVDAIAGETQLAFPMMLHNPSKSPFSKMFRIKVPVNKKVFYKTGDLNNVPQNYADGTYIILLSSWANTRPQDVHASYWPDNYKVDLLSTTAFTDM